MILKVRISFKLKLEMKKDLNKSLGHWNERGMAGQLIAKTGLL
jgi:hypothetical protein